MWKSRDTGKNLSITFKNIHCPTLASCFWEKQIDDTFIEYGNVFQKLLTLCLSKHKIIGSHYRSFAK